MQHSFHIFTDASYDAKQHLGVAGLLVIQEPLPNIQTIKNNENHLALHNRVQLTTFTAKTNGQAELQGAVWALEEIARLQQHNHPDTSTYTLHTDSTAVATLPGRRQRLETHSFVSKRTGKPLNNAALYRVFLSQFDQTHPQLNWIKGHTATEQRNELHRCFRVVDLAVRKKLREMVSTFSIYQSEVQSAKTKG